MSMVNAFWVRFRFPSISVRKTEIPLVDPSLPPLRKEKNLIGHNGNISRNPALPLVGEHKHCPPFV